MTREQFYELTGFYPEIINEDCENMTDDDIDDILFSQEADNDKWIGYYNSVL